MSFGWPFKGLLEPFRKKGIADCRLPTVFVTVRRCRLPMPIALASRRLPTGNADRADCRCRLGTDLNKELSIYMYIYIYMYKHYASHITYTRTKSYFQ